ncbi:glycoside hydrolase family 5 protein [Rubellicoccus peritrichatus]|uniref:Cellulase family glycosylhydrolase n=1 Tax=Rubellicoccus peritrichatus TaxID=3080537 RepID=A0AAQ3LC03_9BACT|nr:cellulase family glycosylhydrolase [Puniceicoccus sp. CR14]WOO41617.1 cellulase family glycosylhydrolase [Puniceicoccus sp. CR14]
MSSGCTETKDYTFQRGVNISHWLSQNHGDRTYAADWFTEEDVQWIANQGFDHIRIPIDPKYWMDGSGGLNEEAIVPFDQASEWAKQHGLGVILDMHYLPGANFHTKENSLFTDPELLEEVADFWSLIAERYASAGPWLRFELLNEPVAEENKQLNPVMARLLDAIRESNPTRVVYLTSNKWSSFNTIWDLRLPDDPNIALTLHFYEPFPFTHQRTEWTDLKPSMPQVDFPGIVPDLKDLLPAGHSWLSLTGQHINAENSVDPKFEELAKWAKKNAPNLEIHIGEFGAYNTATPESIQNYYAAVVEASERHGFGWAMWDYQGGFAIRGSNNLPTTAMKGIEEGINASVELSTVNP